MKSAYLFSYKGNFFLVVFSIVVFSLFCSCKKDNTGEVGLVVGEAKIKLINASQNSSAIDFYLDNAKINSSALAYGEISEYIKIGSGKKTTKVNQGANLLETSVGYNFMPTFSYTSFFVEDKGGDGEILTFEDNLGAVESDKSRIRFINLSPNFTNSIRISLAGGELVVSDLPFKASSGYFLVQPGANIGVSITGGGAFKIASGKEFEGGKNYTIWLSGSSNANLTINKITYN